MNHSRKPNSESSRSSLAAPWPDRWRSAGPGGGEAELDAGEEEPALFPELVLLGRPPAGRFLADVVAAGDVLLDQRNDRAP
jgi:hypothetical protein